MAIKPKAKAATARKAAAVVASSFILLINATTPVAIPPMLLSPATQLTPWEGVCVDCSGMTKSHPFLGIPNMLRLNTHADTSDFIKLPHSSQIRNPLRRFIYQVGDKVFHADSTSATGTIPSPQQATYTLRAQFQNSISHTRRPYKVRLRAESSCHWRHQGRPAGSELSALPPYIICSSKKRRLFRRILLISFGRPMN